MVNPSDRNVRIHTWEKGLMKLIPIGKYILIKMIVKM